MSDRISLLDINVLVALAWPNHVHHERAHLWFGGIGAWATCPLTQSGFVRVSSNPSAIPDARSPAEVITLLAKMVSVRDHRFWTDEVSIAEGGHGLFGRVVGHRQVTDAHLLELALTHGGCVASFDRGLRDLAPPTAPADEIVLLIP